MLVMYNQRFRAVVECIVHQVADQEVLRRFGHVGRHDIAEKSPGDPVTTADLVAEEILSKRLSELLPGSVVVGEEAVAQDPDVLKRIRGEKPVWIIDPVDGTWNFVSGNPRFATLVALAERGTTIASWTYAPALGVTATASVGEGAHVNGRQVKVNPAPPIFNDLDVSAPHPRWWSADQRQQFDALRKFGVQLRFFDSACLEYVELACGRRSATILTWQHPWDHAAGLLLHAEAGGTAVSASGEPYHISGGNLLPLVAAPDAGTAFCLQSALAA